MQTRRPSKRNLAAAASAARIREQGPIGQVDAVFQGAERATTLVPIEIMPVTGTVAAQLDHAGAGSPWWCPLDVGQPPLVPLPAAVREHPRHPGFGCCAQPSHDLVQVVTNGCGVDDVQVNHWNTRAGTTPVKKLLSGRTAMNPKRRENHLPEEPARSRFDQRHVRDAHGHRA